MSGLSFHDPSTQSTQHTPSPCSGFSTFVYALFWPWKVWMTSPGSKSPVKAPEVVADLESQTCGCRKWIKIRDPEVKPRWTSMVTNGHFPAQLSTHVVPGTKLTGGLPERDCPHPMLFEFGPSTFKGNSLSTTSRYSPIQQIPHYLPCSTTLFGKGLGSPELSLVENRTLISFFRVLIFVCSRGIWSASKPWNIGLLIKSLISKCLDHSVVIISWLRLKWPEGHMLFLQWERPISENSSWLNHLPSYARWGPLGIHNKICTPATIFLLEIKRQRFSCIPCSY